MPLPAPLPAPVLGSMRFGDWGARLSPADLAHLLAVALDHGIDTLDLADIYGGHTTNALVGAALAHDRSLRPRLHLLAKIGIVLADTPGNGRRVQYYDLSPAHLDAALETSLHDLGVAQVDTVMLHRFDPRMDVDAVAHWVAERRQRGTFRQFGVSNFPATALGLFTGRLAISGHQIELSPAAAAALDDGTHAASRAIGAEVQAWSPLGGGVLLADDERGGKLDAIAGDFGLDRAGLLLRWAASLPQTRVVLGTTRPKRVADALQAVSQPLPADAWFAVLQAARGRPVA